MSNPSTSRPEIARLRSDLEVIQAAIGSGLPFDRMDIRFCWAIAATAVIFGGSAYLSPDGWGGLVPAGLPLLVTIAAYLFFLGLRARRRSKTSPTIRKESRLGITMVALVVVSLPLLRRWAIGLDLDLPPKVIDAIFVITLGIATVGMSFVPFATAAAFRRLSIGGAGISLIALGLLIPSLTATTRAPVLGACLFVNVVYQALLMGYFLNRQARLAPSPAADGE